MDCQETRVNLVALDRGWLSSPAAQEVRDHLDGCEACRRARDAEDLLDRLLREKLPRLDAPEGLRRSLAGLVRSGPVPAPLPVERRRWQRLVAPTLAAALALVVAGLLLDRRVASEEARRDVLVGEAVSDHLRTLVSEQPLAIASGGTHEVKPWFEGRIEFAPVVPLPPLADLRLRGGAVGYFLDRKAAVVSYTLRRHAVTLIAFRAEGLGWPGPASAGHVQRGTTRGFGVALWRAGDLGYALVSDVSPEELGSLAAAFASATVP